MQDNLPELRDIHIPDGVSMFPPAYGWWVILAGVIVLALLFELFLILRKKSKKAYALRLLSQINQNNIVPAAVEISEILRRICVYKYPAANALYGENWVNFLNNHTKQKLPKNTVNLLINAPYIPANTKTFDEHDIYELTTFAKKWIGENL